MAVDVDSNSRWASKETVCEITQIFARPTRIDQVLLDEYEENGEFRIQEFVLEAQVNGTWQSLAQGTDIGAERLFEFGPVEASALRLRILKASVAPSIHVFSAFAANPK